MTTRKVGAALAMVLVALAVASLLIAAQAATMITRQRIARQARFKTQAQWLAESALDRARVSQPTVDMPLEAWQPEVIDSKLPPQHASFQVETSDSGQVTLAVVARVGSAAHPQAAQHKLRETINMPVGEIAP